MRKNVTAFKELFGLAVGQVSRLELAQSLVQCPEQQTWTGLRRRSAVRYSHFALRNTT